MSGSGATVPWERRSLAEARVALVIPCRNEAHTLEPAVRSLLQGDYPGDRLEVVIAEGRSDDDTRGVADRLAAADARVRVVDNERRVTPVGMNLGLAACPGADVIAVLSAHAVYPANLVSALVGALDAHDADGAGGVTRLHHDGSRRGRAICAVLQHPLGSTAVHRRGAGAVRPATVVFPGCFRRTVFDTLGGYNEALVRAQDREFSERVLAAGGRLIQVPAVTMGFHPRLRIGAHLRWTARGAYWLFVAGRRSSVRVVRARNLAPLALLAAHAGPLLPVHPAAGWSVLALYGLLLASGARWLASSPRRSPTLRTWPTPAAASPARFTDGF